jgi:hypothetical protein
MSTPKHTSGPKILVWPGRILTVLVGLFLLMDAVMKLVKPEVVVRETMKMGYPEATISGMGIALLISVILYLLPRTAVLGAILVTGYLGGAVASQVRVEAGAVDIAFPVIFGIVVWAALFLQDARLRALIPLRRRHLVNPA